MGRAKKRVGYKRGKTNVTCFTTRKKKKRKKKKGEGGGGRGEGEESEVCTSEIQKK